MSEYKDVVWSSGDNYDKEKLQDMADNSRLVYQRLPRMVYNAYGVTRTENIKFAGGVAITPSSQNTHAVYTDVYFNGFFSPGCTPIVTCTPMLTPWAWVTVLVMAPGSGQNTSPNHIGFRIGVTDNTGDKRALTKPYHIAWHAMGW